MAKIKELLLAWHAPDETQPARLSVSGLAHFSKQDAANQQPYLLAIGLFAGCNSPLAPPAPLMLDGVPFSYLATGGVRPAAQTQGPHTPAYFYPQGYGPQAGYSAGYPAYGGAGNPPYPQAPFPNPFQNGGPHPNYHPQYPQQPFYPPKNFGHPQGYTPVPAPGASWGYPNGPRPYPGQTPGAAGYGYQSAYPQGMHGGNTNAHPHTAPHVGQGYVPTNGYGMGHTQDSAHYTNGTTATGPHPGTPAPTFGLLQPAEIFLGWVCRETLKPEAGSLPFERTVLWQWPPNQHPGDTLRAYAWLQAMPDEDPAWSNPLSC